MPTPTVEQLRKVESSLRGVLTEKGKSMEPAARRRTRKRLRRAQRRRRGMLAETARKAARAKKTTAEPAAKES